uniref:GIY-YIG domain-containing protein n=1 Tax=viral metagenome TaxID=1070528 RepID=A0A6C0AD24_9ZZZZ
MITVYILKLETDKYYIGRTTKNVYERVLDHSKGEAGYWTKIYKPKELIDFKPNADKFDVDLYVKKYMDKYGINNVRGGTYSSPKLTNEKYNVLREELANANFEKVKKARSKVYNKQVTKIIQPNLDKKEQECTIM